MASFWVLIQTFHHFLRKFKGLICVSFPQSQNQVIFLARNLWVASSFLFFISRQTKKGTMIWRFSTLLYMNYTWIQWDQFWFFHNCMTSDACFFCHVSYFKHFHAFHLFWHLENVCHLSIFRNKRNDKNLLTRKDFVKSLRIFSMRNFLMSGPHGS